MINAGEMRKRLAYPKGRAERLAQDARSAEEKIKEIYQVAFAREPRPNEMKTAMEYLKQRPVNAAGQAIDAQRAARENLQDLLWAIMNTKEFLFNH